MSRFIASDPHPHPHPLRRSALAAAGALALSFASLASLAPAAHADILFFPGAGFVQPEENVLLPSGQTGTTITGATNQTNAVVTFTQPLSPEPLTTPANGQARIAAVDGLSTSLRTSLAGNTTFTTFEANPNFVGTGLFTVSVVEDNGQINNFQTTFATGSNFFGVQAINGQRISFIDIFGPTNSLQDVRQIRIGGVQGPGITPVPEPSQWAAMGMAGMSICGLMLRAKRRKSDKSSATAAA